MIYLTLQQVKEYLWITDGTQDARLTNLIEGVEAWVLSYIGDIRLKDWSTFIEKKEQVLLSTLRENVFYLKSKNIFKIIEINWIDVSAKVPMIDYWIYENDTISDPNICIYLSWLQFWSFIVKYHSWYDQVPSDFIQAILWMVVWEYQKTIANQNSWIVKKETLWPRTTEYDTSWISWNMNKGFSDYSEYSVLKKYLPLHITNYAF